MNDEFDVDLQNAVSEAAQVLLRIFRFASNAFSAWEHFEMYDEAIESATESQAAIEKYRTLTIWEDLSPLNFTLLELNIWSLYDRLGQFIRELRERDEDLLLDRGSLSSLEEIRVIRRYFSVLKNRYGNSVRKETREELKENVRETLTIKQTKIFNFLARQKRAVSYDTLREQWDEAGFSENILDSGIKKALYRLDFKLADFPIGIEKANPSKRVRLTFY